ncbi:MAG: PLDc N-terminal domain-containing protein [Promethearchaeota archaeon]
MIFDTEQDFHMMDWWYDVFGPAWWIFMALGWVIYFGVGILLGYYVHKDAIRRNIANSELWLFLVIIFNIIGVLIYLLVRKNYQILNREQK